MDFNKVLDEEIVENFSLDGVYEEVIAFNDITENLYKKLQAEHIKSQIMKYFENVNK